MTLSIIIPVYKTGKTLYRCLDSVFNQLSCADEAVEVIAVNDASPDDCGSLLEAYRERHPELRIVTHEQNKGEAGAHNTGIEKSIGEYFTFLDSDDAYRGDAIEKILKVIKQYRPDLIHYSYARVDESGKYLSRSVMSSQGLHSVDTIIEKARRSLFYDTAFGIMTAGGVYRRDVAPELRMNPQFPISGERYYGWQFFAKCRTVYQMDDILYDYYQYPNTLSKVWSDRAVDGLLELDIRFWREMQQHAQFRSGGKYAFRRLFPGFVGWHYELVFLSEPDKRKFAGKYFEALAGYLTGGVALRELGLMYFCLKFISRYKSVRLMHLYRAVFYCYVWRAERKMKRIFKRLFA